MRIIHTHNNMYVYAWVGLGHYRVQNSRLYLNNNLLGKLQIVPKNGTFNTLLHMYRQKIKTGIVEF